MAKAVNVRVEVRLSNNPGHEERDSAFRKMLGSFRKHCVDNGVMHAYKQHETFESRSRKKRRKQREYELAALKAKIKENFPIKKK